MGITNLEGNLITDAWSGTCNYIKIQQEVIFNLNLHKHNKYRIGKLYCLGKDYL